MNIIQVFRKSHERFFSIESVFSRIRQAWPVADLPEKIMLPVSGVSLKNLLFLYRESRKRKAAVFHVTGDAHYAVLALPRRQTILTIHDAVFLEQQKGMKRWFLKKILLDIPVRYSPAITTISEKSKSEILRYTSCDPGKIRVIPNPVSTAIQYREKPFNTAEPHILFIGVKPNKNLERVSVAIRDLPCRLTIIGKLFPEQVRLLDQHRIRYDALHGITEEEMAEQFAQSDIILFPSLYEGFGLPVIEGFRAGRVVVTSDISPMKDIAENAACLVDPYRTDSIREGLEKVIRDPAYRDRLVRLGLEIVKKYEPEAIARRYYQLYQEISNETCAE